MMTLQSSGPISIGDINVELGFNRNTNINLNDPIMRGLAGIPSGPISLSDFYGKSANSYIPMSAQIIYNDYVGQAGYSYSTLYVDPYIDVSGGSGGYSYQWTIIGGSPNVSDFVLASANALNPSISIQIPPKNGFFGYVEIRCVVTDNTNHSITTEIVRINYDVASYEE